MSSALAKLRYTSKIHTDYFGSRSQEMTKLERIVNDQTRYKELPDGCEKSERQAVLDDITSDTIKLLSPKDIVEHTSEVYGATVSEYDANPHTKQVITELLYFMNFLKEGNTVLDIGCGTGRDTLFMSCKDIGFRESLIKESTLKNYVVPEHALRVLSIDISSKMLLKAIEKLVDLKSENIDTAYAPHFHVNDMHRLISLPEYSRFHGIWSCTALFTHTPRELMDSAMRDVAGLLCEDGIFFTSYTSGRPDGRYDKLLLSSTGRIKYFSQPDPKEIRSLAEKYGMELTHQTLDDYVIDGKVIKEDLFASQFFRKVR